MNKILLWGTGDRSQYFIAKKLLEDVEILAVIDSYGNLSTFEGYNVIKPLEIHNYIDNVDYIVICNQYYQEILIKIVELGISIKKVIITDHVLEQPFKECYERGKDIIPSAYKMMENNIFRSVKANERDYTDKRTIYHCLDKNIYEYKSDYFRYRTFEFVSELIENRQIEGEIAELGVFRGVFSALLNIRFSDRKLYLFDTFEGFNAEEAQKEVEMGRCNETFITAHKDTSVERMLQNLPFPEQAIVCKGFFPESIPEFALEEKFAFVSLDVDFEESTFEGLKFFYPRLVTGGYIFVHDYNTYYLEGVKTAVKRYEAYIGQRLCVVPIADRAGTLIITK